MGKQLKAGTCDQEGGYHRKSGAKLGSGWFAKLGSGWFACSGDPTAEQSSCPSLDQQQRLGMDLSYFQRPMPVGIIGQSTL